MIKLCETKVSHLVECPYLPEKEMQFKYFFAKGLNESELDHYLSRGWRKFGLYYFKPECPGCTDCIPIRIPVEDFKPSRSQRRILKKSPQIEVKFNRLQFREEIFELYKDHSLNRFGKESDIEDFMNSFYMESCPTMQSEYYLEDELIAVGFLDYSEHGLSSIYFIYNTSFSDLNLGTYSILREIEITRSLGLKYYYLGYYIEENRSMCYKGNFRPHETMNWETEEWTNNIT